MLQKDSSYFHELQTHTGWSRTLASFAEWCSPQPEWSSLDVGCGPGLLPSIFARLGCKAFGVDVDLEMFLPSPLHPLVAIGDVHRLPFCSHTFDLITASNLLFLLPEPVSALLEMKRLLRTGGKVAMLNPTENLTEQAALAFVEQRGLEGVARNTLLNWARRAEEHHVWTEAETQALYAKVGMRSVSCIVKMGPGFARFSSGMV
jgi:SAM-dependent methyltransferase